MSTFSNRLQSSGSVSEVKSVRVFSWLAWVIGVVGLVISVGLFQTLRMRDVQLAAAEFEADAINYIDSIEAYLPHSTTAGASFKALFGASQHVDREEFRVFAQEMIRIFPDVTALEWLPRLPDSRRSEFEQQISALEVGQVSIKEFDADGQLVIAGQRDEYFPVLYEEPFSEFVIELGFDNASDPARLEAMQRAQDTGRSTVTSRHKTIGVGEAGRHQDVDLLFFTPVYRNGSSVESVEDRREHLLGFISSIVHLNGVITMALRPMPEADIDIYL